MPSRPSCSGRAKTRCSPPMSSSRPGSAILIRDAPMPAPWGAFSPGAKKQGIELRQVTPGPGRAFHRGAARIGPHQESGAGGAAAFFRRSGDAPRRRSEPVFLRARQETLCGGRQDARPVFLRARQETLCGGRQDARVGPRAGASIARFPGPLPCRGAAGSGRAGRADLHRGAGGSHLARLRRGDLQEQETQRVLRFREKGGKQREIPVRHDLDGWIDPPTSKQGKSTCLKRPRRCFWRRIGGDWVWWIEP